MFVYVGCNCMVLKSKVWMIIIICIIDGEICEWRFKKGYILGLLSGLGVYLMLIKLYIVVIVLRFNWMCWKIKKIIWFIIFYCFIMN